MSASAFSAATAFPTATPSSEADEQRVVVFRVADRRHAVRGYAEVREARYQAMALGHPGQQHHQRAPVADELAFQPEPADLGEHRGVG